MKEITGGFYISVRGDDADNSITTQMLIDIELEILSRMKQHFTMARDEGHDSGNDLAGSFSATLDQLEDFNFDYVGFAESAGSEVILRELGTSYDADVVIDIGLYADTLDGLELLETLL